MAWYDTDWSNAFEVTTDPTKIPSSQTDFPVFIDLSQLGGAHAFWTTVRSDGGDIRITKSDGTTEVAREVVDIDTTAKTGEVHFTSDGTLDAVSADTFRVYYGNASATEPAVTATYGAENVWDSDFKMVHHMTGAAYTNLLDSTSNGHDVWGDNSSPTYNATGKIGQGVSFDGVDDDIVILDSDDFSPYTQQTFTVEAWAEFDTTTAHQSVINKFSSPLGGEWSLHYLNIANRRLGATLWTTGGSLKEYADEGTAITANQWYYMATKLTDAHQTTTGMNTVIDGVDQTNYTSEVSNSMGNTTTALRIGRRGDLNWPFGGTVDEVRISSVARSDDWLATTYSSLDAPGTFLSYGAELSAPSAGGGDPTPCQAILVLL